MPNAKFELSTTIGLVVRKEAGGGKFDSIYGEAIGLTVW